MSSSVHRKHASSPGAAQHERAMLRLVEGDGIVPTPATEPGDPLAVDTLAGRGSLADVLDERSRLPEPECRGIGVAVARAVGRVHAHGVGHGDVKPANLVFAPGGELWLADFDAAASFGHPRRRGTPARLEQTAVVDERSDIGAIAVLVIECATTAVIDPAADWATDALVELGCPSELAADLATILATAPDAGRVARILARRNHQVPHPATSVRGVDPTPTIDFAPTAIAGLSPLGGAPAHDGSGLAPPGWRRWAIKGRG